MGAVQPSAQQPIGARIREHREAAGLSQAELARRVYVSRQTVGNWESGRTLADVQSLVLLARAFGTTDDALIGESDPNAALPTAEDRHALVRLLVTAGLLLGATLALVFASHLISLVRPSDDVTDAVRAALCVAALICEIALLLRALPRLRAFMRSHGLKNASIAASYLEGRDASGAVPNDVLFRCFVPYWKLWLLALIVVAFGAPALLVG